MEVWRLVFDACSFVADRSTVGKRDPLEVQVFFVFFLHVVYNAINKGG